MVQIWLSLAGDAAAVVVGLALAVAVMVVWLHGDGAAAVDVQQMPPAVTLTLCEFP